MSADDTRSSLDLLYNVSRELASTLDLRTALQRILYQSLKYVGGERGSLVVLDDTARPVDAAIIYGRKIHDHTTQQLREIIDRGLAGWVVRNRQPAWVPDTSRDERWLRRPDDALDHSGAKSAVCVPLMARERLVGVLTLVHPQPGWYKKDHFNLIQSIADQAGITVMNARLYAESQRQARVMTALATGAAAINATLRLDEVLQRILDETIQALQVETVALALIDRQGDLVFHAATGVNYKSLAGKRVPVGKSIVGWVAREGQGAIVPAVREDQRFLPEVEQFEGLDMRALACAPIFAQGRVIGVLQAINPRADTFDPDAMLVLAGIGNLAGSAIQHAQLFEQLQAAHKHYRELFDDSIDPVLITDLKGRIHESNRQAALLTGFRSRQMQGMQIEDLYETKHSEGAADPLNLKAGRVISFEALLKSKPGRSIPIQVHVRRAVFEEAESLQWILRDISERKDLDTLREELTSMIYHDLRSPLANIISSLDVLTAMYSAPENETANSVLKIAKRSTDRIQRLVNSLLDINRLESGQAVISQQSVTAAMLVDDAMEAARPLIDSRRHTLTSHVPDDLPMVWVDVDMIRRVVINLLENASKFTPPGGRIDLGAKRDGDWVQMWVQDNGPGIPFADQDRIFDKFTRLKMQDAYSGLGVGLAFCRLAVQGHGGKIWVDSRPGHGARFSLTLPVAKEL